MTSDLVLISWSASGAQWPFLAAIGGIIVFCGLWMEHSANKETYRGIDDFRSSKSTAKWGWRILMIGILVEIAVAITLAARDEMDKRQTAFEMAQTSNSVANLDWPKQSVNTVSVEVMLIFDSTERIPQTFNCDAHLDIFQSSLPSYERLEYLLVSDSAQVSGGSPGSVVYFLRFSPISSLSKRSSYDEIPRGRSKPVKIVGDALDSLFLRFYTFPPGLHGTFGGVASIYLNEKFYKRLSIAPGLIKDGLGTLTNSPNIPD